MLLLFYVITVRVLVVYVGIVLVLFGTVIVGVCVVVCWHRHMHWKQVFPTLSVAKFRASNEYRSASRDLILKIVILQTCLIWPSINKSVAIHPR